jgi:hypothetical protein
VLRQVLAELEAASGPVNINELSRKLGIDRSALEGMIQFWVRKGRLKSGAQAAAELSEQCTTGSCGCACGGPVECPYVIKVPQSYTLNRGS